MMEQFSDQLKTRLKDPAYDYRQDCFLEYLKMPKRTHKESPMTKDYVDMPERDLETMATTLTNVQSDIRLDSESDVLVLDGRVLNKRKIEGVTIGEMQETIDQIPEYVWKEKGKDREEFLINASWSSGYFVNVESNVNATVSIDFRNSMHSGSEKNVIIIGKYSNVKIVETRRNIGEKKGSPTQGKSLYIFLGEGSNFDYNYLQDKELNINDITFIRAFQQEESNFRIFHINHGSGKVLFVNESTQIGNNSDYKVFGATFSNGKQSIDVRDSSFQLGLSTSADIQVRGVVSGQSSTIHRGNVDIELPSVNSTGFYDSKILLLSKEGYANSKPGLVIRNNNTRSKHGSAISNVDKEQILYLQSRGIDEKTSVNLITGGFIESILQKSDNPSFIEQVNIYSKELVD